MLLIFKPDSYVSARVIGTNIYHADSQKNRCIAIWMNIIREKKFYPMNFVVWNLLNFITTYIKHRYPIT